jgi:hypothetical protein
MVAAAVAAAAVVGGAYSANQQSKAARKGASAQEQAALAGIDEQSRQFDKVQQLLSPYVNAGNQSLGAQKGLLGLNGQDAQQQAIDAIQNGPQFQAMLNRGQTSILQNASATGGLRGGNTQAALAQFSPTLLAQTINDQYSKLMGVTSMGQNAAAGTGNAAMASGNAISNLLQQQGAAQAGGALGEAKAQTGYANAINSAFGAYAGMGGKGGGINNLYTGKGSTGSGIGNAGAGDYYAWQKAIERGDF